MRKGFRNIFCSLISVFTVFLIFPSCRVVKNLPDGETLLKQNKFIVHSPGGFERNRIREDLLRIASQKPNRKFLQMMPVRMWLYYSASHGKKLTKFKQWIIDKVGEAPVVYDSLLTPKSLRDMNQYLWNIGYYHSSITDSIVTKKRRTTVIYTVNSGNLWRIGEVELPKGHTPADSIVREARLHSFLRNGERVDMSNLNRERERIEAVLRNAGYYYFNREYVSFVLDSFGSEHMVNIKIFVNQPQDPLLNKQYQINNIYVLEDYNAELFGDTLLRDTVKQGEFRFITGKRKFREKLLHDAIFFKRGDLYTRDAEVRTINRFSQLGSFKFIGVDFVRSKDTVGDFLDCIINLSPALRNSYTWTAEANVTNEGLFGTVGSVSFKNKNLTKNSDQLIFDVSGGVQLKFAQKPAVQVITGNFNTGLTYYLNKFLVPFRTKLSEHNINPKTRINVSYGYEHRFDYNSADQLVFLYDLHNFGFTYGYEWNPKPAIHHLLNPLSVTFFLLPKTGEEFIQRLDSIPILKSAYQEQVIIGPNYTFTYTNQHSPNDKKYMNLRVSVETAGNLIQAAFKLANFNDVHDSLYLIANRPFAEYFRMEADWRNYFRLNKHSTFVIRTYGGFGVPYGNSLALPFIKQFYVGGPNDLRGFLIREIGPGGYADPTVYNQKTGAEQDVSFFNQTGDIKLEANAEYRFDIYRWLKGAFFTDAGNVWTVRPDNRALGNFAFNRFLTEFAVDAGPGLRFDFGYFVVRFDYGFPLRDPRRLEGLRWQFDQWQAFKNGQLQLAIGYPF